MPKRHLAVVVAGLNQTLPAGKLDVWTMDANKPMNTKEAMIPGVYSFAAEIPPTARIAGVECAICKVNRWHAQTKPRTQYLNLALSEHLKQT